MADEIRETDENRNAVIHKRCSEAFFRELKEEFRGWLDGDVTIKDVEYFDGYFIFSFGTNSVVHFRIEECPGWLFGVWWGEPDKDGNVPGEFFAQYEETIDKFKPSASEIYEDFCVLFDLGNPHCDMYHIALQIRFIRDEPYLAFCRDYLMWDYNTEYHTREEAKEEFYKFRHERDRHYKYQEICEKRILDYFRNEVVPNLEDGVLYYDADICPAYEVRAPFSKNKQNAAYEDVFDEPGLYTFEDDGYDALVSECDRLCEQNNTWWNCPIEPRIYIYDDTQQGVAE